MNIMSEIKSLLIELKWPLIGAAVCITIIFIVLDYAINDISKGVSKISAELAGIEKMKNACIVNHQAPIWTMVTGDEKWCAAWAKMNYKSGDVK